MARPLRIEFPGAVYHITSRGNERKKIFWDDQDRELYLARLDQIHERFHWHVHAYVLMSNHCHLLVETPMANLSRGMRQLNGVYTQEFNRRHGRVGHLFQGRFKAILVEEDNYLLEVSRYIILNPVRAGMVERPEEYRWSSYPSIIGMGKTPAFLARELLLAQFGRNKKQAINQFINFVMNGIEAEFPTDALHAGVILGTPHFLEKIQGKIKEKSDQVEIPRMQRHSSRESLEEIFKISPKDKAERNKRIYRAYVRNGYTMKEIADCLGVHDITSSRAVNRMENPKK